MKIRRVSPSELQHGREYLITFVGDVIEDGRDIGDAWRYAGRYLRMSDAERHVPIFGSVVYRWQMEAPHGDVSRFPPRHHTFWEVLE